MNRINLSSASLLKQVYNDIFAIAAAAVAGIISILSQFHFYTLSESDMISIILGTVSLLSINEFKKKWDRKTQLDTITDIKNSIDEVKQTTSGKIEEMLKVLGGKFGQGVTEEEMLDFYDKLKVDATEYHVVWCLNFQVTPGRIEDYLEKEKKLITVNGLKVWRLVHNEIGVIENLKKYGEQLSQEKNYHQVFGYGYRNMEIGYSYYVKEKTKISSRGLIILADDLKRPKIGFYFDGGINPDHAHIIDVIKNMFDSEWQKCEQK